MDFLYATLFVCYASYPYNRKSVTFAIPTLKEEGLDTSHAGLIISCQNLAFAISKFSAGVLSDRLNPYFLLATGLFVSGIVTISFSWSTSVVTFCCLWFLNGLAQGCGWPAIAKILRQRASPSQFGTLWSLLSSSNNVAGSLNPILSAFVILHFGWRWSVFLAGFVTVFLGVMFLLSLPFISGTSDSNTHSTKKTDVEEDRSNFLVNQRCDSRMPLSWWCERHPIMLYSAQFWAGLLYSFSAVMFVTVDEKKSSIFDLLLDPFIWLLSFGFMVVFCARSTTIDWGQSYLIEEKNHSRYMASAFTSSVEIGGFVGRLAAGYLTDWVIKRNETSSKQITVTSKPKLRLSVAMVFMLGSVISIHLFKFAVAESSSSAWITSIGAFMGMCYYGPIAIFGIVSSESVPPHLSGSSHAIVALFGNIGAAISGLPFSYIAKYHSWSTVFFILEIIAGGTLLLFAMCRNLTPKIEKYDKEK